MKIKVKKLYPDSVLPIRATAGAGGYDLTAVKVEKLGNGRIKCYSGIAIEMPEGCAGFVFPRSSVWKRDCLMTNGVGLIDNDYRGEITGVFDHYGTQKEYMKGDRFAQLVIVPLPEVNFVEVEELSETKRGAGGYGSTGR